MSIRRSDRLMAHLAQPRHADEAARMAVDADVLPQHVPRQWDVEEAGDLP
jgi:hypothetical protein